ncbi:MAG: outer membrane protein [Chitinophagales bacterium]|jgi:outer membrane protein
MKNLASLFLLIFTSTLVFAQETWSFEDCVAYALDNNINVSQSKLNIEYAANNVLQNKMDLYTPNINVNVTEGFNFGNSVDPLTYQFIRQSTNSTTLGMFIDFSLFQGMSRMMNLKASALELNATQFDQMELENSTKLQLANHYLNAMLAKEALQISQEQKILTLNQYNNTLELVRVGALAKGDQYEVEAQMANDEVNLINAENTLESALNQIKFVLQLNPFQAFDIVGLGEQDIDVEFSWTDLAVLSENAVNILPNVKSAELRQKAAAYQLKAAKGSLSPTISVSGYLGSNYFSASQKQVGETSVTAPVGFVSGSNNLVFATFQQPVFGDQSFGMQVGDNFNQNVRINLNIPIFGKWQRMIAIDNAKLGIMQSEYELKTKQNSLNQDVFTAQTSLKAAVKQFTANKKNLDAATVAYSYAEEKFKFGVINTYEFETVKNRLVTAQTSLAQAKFEYMFRKAIVQFYETGDLTF